MALTMTAFTPDGRAYPVPQADYAMMHAHLHESRQQPDVVTYAYDVTDRDGNPMRVLATLWQGLILFAFNF